jgi:excisionase family DNA binding protein
MTEATLNRLITTKEAAQLLRVSSRTVLNWIDNDAIPYLALPQSGNGRREYRIPLYGLVRSLEGNYDLGAHLEKIDATTKGLELSEGVTTLAPAEHAEVGQKRIAVAETPLAAAEGLATR